MQSNLRMYANVSFRQYIISDTINKNTMAPPKNNLANVYIWTQVIHVIQPPKKCCWICA